VILKSYSFPLFYREPHDVKFHSDFCSPLELNAIIPNMIILFSSASTPNKIILLDAGLISEHWKQI